MIKPHEPFQDGSKHAANEYCPSCHGPFDLKVWDSDGMYRPENQQRGTTQMSHEQARHEILMNFSQTGIAPNHVTSADAMLADIIIRLMRIEAMLKAQQSTSSGDK